MDTSLLLNNYYYFDEFLFHQVFVFAVDSSPRARGSGATHGALRAVRAAVSSLRQMKRTSLGPTASKTPQPQSPMRVTVNSLEPYLPTPPLSKPSSEDLLVGLVTFDGMQIHFYSVAMPPMPLRDMSVRVHVVDADDPFCPLPSDQWLLELDEPRLDELLTRISSGPQEEGPGHNLTYSKRPKVTFSLIIAPSSHSCPAAAVRAVQDGLRALGGRLWVFTSSHSTCGLGRVNCPREELAAYGSPKEFNSYSTASFMSTPTDSLMGDLWGGGDKKGQEDAANAANAVKEGYEGLAEACFQVQLSVSVLLCVEQPALHPDFVDSALLGGVCARTGGRLTLFSGPLLQEQVLMHCVTHYPHCLHDFSQFIFQSLSLFPSHI